MKSSVKETCAHYAVKATQGVIVAAAMPAIFAIGLVGVTALAAMKTVNAAGETIKKIKKHTTGKGR